MEKNIFYNFLIVVFLTVILMSLGFLFAVNYYNVETAKTYSDTLLTMIETDIKKYNISSIENFRDFVKQFENNDIRITIINKDGVVIADTIRENIDLMPFDNHIEREEIKKSLNENKIVYSIRKSLNYGERFLYSSKKINIFGESIFLRVAIKTSLINKYVIHFMFTALIVSLVIIFIVILILPIIVKNIMKPFEVIKSNLSDISKNVKTRKLNLSEYDEINIILYEINSVACSLNDTIIKYQSEKNKLDYVLENIEQAVIALNKNYNVVFVNNFCSSITESIISDKPKHIIEIIRDDELLKKINKALENKSCTKFDTEYKNKIIETTVLPINESEDISFLIKLSDVTDIRKLVNEKQDFFVNASHELNTPLTSILGYSELLENIDFEKADTKEKHKDFANRINKEARRMNILVSDMLLLSKTEGNWLDFNDEKINFKDIVLSVIESFKIKIKEKNITLKTDINSSFIFANYEKITEVVANIIDNAIKYTKENGTVEIKLFEEKNSKIIFSVLDTGVGIPSKYLNRVFERFFRVKNMPEAQGTGLGLTIVKNICVHYKAEIYLKSIEGDGTEVTIIFNSFKS